MRSFSAVLAIATAAIACSDAAGPTAPEQAIPVIVAFGDSLTSGPGLPPEQTYPALLQQRSSSEGYAYRVVNAGRAGDTTSTALARLEAALVPDTQILILAIGINDGLRGVPPATVERNIGEMVERAKARDIQVLLCGMEAPPIGSFNYTIEFHRAFTRTAERYKLPLVPFFLLGIVGNNELNLDDTLHPNAAGHKVIAEAIWPRLRPLLVRR
jgi:acyl-CoA thioesterase-1